MTYAAVSAALAALPQQGTGYAGDPFIPAPSPEVIRAVCNGPLDEDLCTSLIRLSAISDPITQGVVWGTLRMVRAQGSASQALPASPMPAAAASDKAALVDVAVYAAQAARDAQILLEDLRDGHLADSTDLRKTICWSRARAEACRWFLAGTSLAMDEDLLREIDVLGASFGDRLAVDWWEDLIHCVAPDRAWWAQVGE